MAWAAIWQDGARQPLDEFGAFLGSPSLSLPALTLSLEMTMPRRSRKALRLWQGASEAHRALAIYLMPDGALRIVKGEDMDVSTPAGFLRQGQVLCLRLVICAEGRRDVIHAVNADTAAEHRLRTGLALPVRLNDALPRAPGFTGMAHLAAIATHAAPAMDLPGIEDGAMVTTPSGPVPVERLRVGDTVLCDDGRTRAIRWTDAREGLCLGRAAPVLLRAPYHGLEADVCVTPQTRILRLGPEVEYLAGTDKVLVRAADLVCGGSARFDRSRPLRRFHHILLDDPACLQVWRCPIETAFLSEVLDAEATGSSAARPLARDCAPSLPLLDRAAARALLSRGSPAQRFLS